MGLACSPAPPPGAVRRGPAVLGVLVLLVVGLAACGDDPEPERGLADLEDHAAARCAGWTAALGELPTDLPTDPIGASEVLDRALDALSFSHPAYDEVPSLGDATDYPEPEHRALHDTWTRSSSDLRDAVLGLRNDLGPGSADLTDETAFLRWIRGQGAIATLTGTAITELGVADCDGLAPLTVLFEQVEGIYGDAWAPFALTGDLGTDIEAACTRHLDDVPLVLGPTGTADAILGLAEIEDAYEDLAVDLSRLTAPDPASATALDELVAAVDRIAGLIRNADLPGVEDQLFDELAVAAGALETLDATC